MGLGEFGRISWGLRGLRNLRRICRIAAEVYDLEIWRQVFKHEILVLPQRNIFSVVLFV